MRLPDQPSSPVSPSRHPPPAAHHTPHPAGMASPWVQLRSQLEALLDSFEQAIDKPAAGRRLLEAATDFQQAVEALLDEPRVATCEADATVQ